jgi:hypothetical protein
MANRFLLNGASAALGLSISLCLAAPTQAASVEEKLAKLTQSMQLCITKASRPGSPYYHRSEAAQACQQTKEMLHAFGQEANRNRNLSCSSRIASLDFDVWMIQFIGGKRMQAKSDDAIKQLSRNCYNMDTHH